MSPLTIPIDALSEQLLLRRIAENDYAVEVEAGEHGRLAAGRIMRVSRATGRTCWFWTITGPAAPDAGVALAGEAEDLESAKIDFRRAFDRLLYWAGMVREGELGWHVPAQRVGG